MDEHGYDRLVVYADREHSANLAYLTGFDPRFEEAMLVVGGSDEPAILVGNECFGMAGAAPLPMRRSLFQDFSLPGQPRDRSRPLSEILAGRGRSRGQPRRRRRLEDVRRPRRDRGARLHRGRAPADDRGRHRRERRAPAHRRGRRAPRDQRGRTARRLRVRGVPDLARRPAAALGAPAGDAGARRRPAARVERRAALVPPDAVERGAGVARPAQPGRPAHRARATASRSRSASGAR